MNTSGLSDARKVPDEVMNDLRRLAVRAVEERGHSPEWIAAIFGISRSRLYEWLRRYRAHGEAALDTRTAPGAPRVITRGMGGCFFQLPDTQYAARPESALTPCLVIN